MREEGKNSVFSPLPAFYKGKRVFLTGHTGFKGAWLTKLLTGFGAQVTGYALPPEGEKSLYGLLNPEREMHSVFGDVRDMEGLWRAFDGARPQIVLHLAAQPLVRESYQKPRETFEVNVMGTVNLLECARRAGYVRSLVNVTTDKVYENQERIWGYREYEPLDGYDPYSNSKSCSELVTHSYTRSFFAGTPTAVSTARAGNVIGGGDFAADRILPDCIRAALSKRPVALRNPGSLRPYQHVLDPLMAYLLIAFRQYEDASLGGSYNVGPEERDCVTTGELATLFCGAWGDGMRWEAVQNQGPHEANFLKLDCAKLRSAMGWKPRWHIETAVEKTVEWTKVWQAGGDVAACMDRQAEAFLAGGTEG